MGVCLTLTRTHTAEFSLDRVQAFAREHCAQTLILSRRSVEAGHDTLGLALHPAAPFVDLGDGRLRVDTKTSTVGPGYHQYVAEFALALGRELSIVWDPPDPDTPTGADRAALEHEFLQGLKTMARMLLEKAEEGGGQMAMSMEVGWRYQHEGLVATPMGPRDEAWLRAVADDPRRGVDVFPWWEEGLGASHWLGRALAIMWTNVRWRIQLNGEEEDLFHDVTGWLERALALDPEIAMPWREWFEINLTAHPTDRRRTARRSSDHS